MPSGFGDKSGVNKIMIIKNRCINATRLQEDGAWSGGLELFDGQPHIVRDCVIDLSQVPLEKMDEALSFSWGCFGEVKNCVIRGAGKLVLCGCGDSDRIPEENGKQVLFENCIFENFSRRAPEAQNGMKAILKNCMIRNWGDSPRFSVRAFGAWAHTPGSEIYAENVIFKQDKFFTRHFLADLIAHIGQAVNDGGVRRIFTREAWQPGICRGLTATCGGKVRAVHCYKNKWWINLENHSNPMSAGEAALLEKNLEEMRARLYNRLGIDGGA